MTLFDAITRGDVGLLEYALREGADVNAVGPKNTTPLIEAARAGLVDIVERLLAAGAEPNWKDDEQETALLKAAANGHATVVAVLAAFASDDERDLAKHFLGAFGQSHAPEYQPPPSDLHRSAVGVAARAAEFLGHEDPRLRLERNDRAQTLPKKPRKS